MLGGEWKSAEISALSHRRVADLVYRNSVLFGAPWFFRQLPVRQLRFDDLVVIGSADIWAPHDHEIRSDIRKRAKVIAVRYRCGCWARPTSFGQSAIVLCSRKLRGRTAEAASFGFTPLA